VDQETHQAKHYVEKPQSFISDTINGGVYLFDKAIFEEFKKAMEVKTTKHDS
jgi:mannose-1-phosphate guanylyltransferase